MRPCSNGKPQTKDKVRNKSSLFGAGGSGPCGAYYYLFISSEEAGLFLPMKLIDQLEGRGHFVSFYPSVAKCFGGIPEGILLSKLISWQDHYRLDGERWMRVTLKFLQGETGLSEKQLRGCRERLEKLGVLESRYERSGHVLYFAIDPERLLELWKEHLPKGQVPDEHLPKGQVAPVERADAARARVDSSFSEDLREEPPNPQGNEVGFDASASEKTKTNTARRRSAKANDPQAILDRMPPNVFLSCNPPLKAAFLNWINHGLQLRYPITVPQFEIHWEKCALMGPEKAIGRIKSCIEHGKNSLDEPRPNGSEPKRNSIGRIIRSY